MQLYDKKSRISEQHIKANAKAMKKVPDGLWVKCPKCHREIFAENLGRYKTCPYCSFGFRIGARERLDWLVDDFDEFREKIPETNPIDFPNYEKKIQDCRQKTEIDESILTGIAKIKEQKFALGIMDPGFIMGSLGSVTGEKITRLFEYATKQQLPVVIFTASGGARMQEGIFSLMQMQKITQAIQAHSQAGLFYLSILTDPTTGGVTASFANESDIILAEPHALIGFAGRRVIEQTMHQKIADDLQSAETLMRNGFIDEIVERKHEKEIIEKLIKLNR
ncbi:acetyl-CoA carboxylase carboxyltransferase subunit beta [Ligilactobacillus sp. LYQ135]